MSRRERLEKVLAGAVPDRIPVAMWRPWPGDDQRAADLARCVVDFQRYYDWDFINILPAMNYMVIDYGVQDQWDGAANGARPCIRGPIKRSLDWTELRALEPMRGEMGKVLMCLNLVKEALNGEAIPIIVTVQSPLIQAARLAGHATFIRHLRQRPDRLLTGLSVLTESTLRYLDALQQAGIDGIYYMMEYADLDKLSEREYAAFGLPQDREILEARSQHWWLNIVYLHGQTPIFDYINSMRPAAVNWHDRSAEIDLTEGRTLFEGAACGGLDTEMHMRQGTPSIVRDMARDAITQMNGRRLILTSGGPVLATTPLSNLRAAREVVEKVSA